MAGLPGCASHENFRALALSGWGVCLLVATSGVAILTASGRLGSFSSELRSPMHDKGDYP